MSSNAQKLPLARSLNAFAQRKALDQMQLMGKALPCSVVAVSGSIVTVNFEVTTNYTLPRVTCPVAGPEYIRLPIQVGDKGYVAAADAYLGGVSGLGGGVADLSMPANLSALVFCPIGNRNWTATPNANALVLYGPDGCILRDLLGLNKVDLTGNQATVKSATTVTIEAPIIILRGAIQFDGAASAVGGTLNLGTTNINTAGEVTAGSIPLTTHHHGGVTTGGGTSGGPVP